MAFSYTGGARNDGNSSSASVTHGQTINSGDLVFVYVNSNSTTSIAIDADAGAAWQADLWDETPSSETARHAAFWKIANGSEPSSYSATTGSAQWEIIVKVFSSAADAEIDASAVTSRTSGTSTNLDCDATDSVTVSDDCVAIVCGGKDNRNAGVVYEEADQSFVSALGQADNQAAGCAHRVYTTGETITGSVVIQRSGGVSDGMSDNTYSGFVSFVESVAGASISDVNYHGANRGIMRGTGRGIG